MTPPRPLGPLGQRFVRCGELARRADDRDGFDAETRELAKAFVAGGMDGCHGSILERVGTVHASLRKSLLLAIVNRADPRAQSVVDGIALVCANLDARIAQYGPLPDPLAAVPEEDPDKPKTKKRRA